ncbi:hypothetical protein vB_PsyM_KIL3b_0083 [Pseudomonas phage vB_PsyM_KIL3b]|uniref:Uncharacterized protein n=2 Tax=Pseudomonas phage vB_PsyM_KIL1 TaxID=1777065 RepID=A0A142IFZ3_9CAUD|nr:hypothetical protein vB_PsyM_KIL3_0083 [Pseudomonas phage vB_PsyM_KIL3]AMR58148.1 hypothetical protein vB_PsyM_KIL3b_0083 [Pseudomonas phage vB_PsyM_KIL3b]
MNYITGILLAIAILCGGLAHYEHRQVKELTLEVSTYKSAAELNLKAKEEADASCIVTVDSLNHYYKEQAKIDESQTTTGTAINSLPTLTIKDKANAAPKKPQTPSETNRYSDDDRLSPDTMRLLDEAYCYGDKDGCSTTTK